MDSPKGDQFIAKSSSRSPLSPSGRSPIFNFLSNLPPIDSDKSRRFTQRPLETNLPTPDPVFTSPHPDFHQETSIVQRLSIGADDSPFHEQWNTKSSGLQISSFGTEVQPCSSSGCVDEYLDSISSAHPWMHSTKEMTQLSRSGYTASKETIKKVDVSDHIQTAVNLRIDGSFGDFPKFTSEINNGYAVSDMNLDNVSGVQHCQRYATQNVDAQHDGGNPTCQPFHESLQIDGACEDSYGSSMPSLKERIYDTWKPVSLDQDLTFLSSRCLFEGVTSTQTDGSSAISSSLPSGTGLRVNNVGRSVSHSDIFASENSTGYRSSQENLMPRSSNFETNFPITSSISAATGTMLSRVDLQEIQASVAATPATSILNNHLSSPAEYLSLTPHELKIASSEGRMSTSQNSDTVNQLKKVTPTRRRKRTGNTSESDGCKGCHCKRSKCLKLYCECFAAKEYCTNSCTCENCSNKPENEGLVLQSRQQIESRNPLAFAPKIVPHDNDSPGNVMEEENLDTPSSARHKRGCNCKKSKCHKGYCDCYQAKVGCSAGCRCESCENPFGTRTAYREAERYEELSHQKQDVAENGKDERREGFSAAEEGLAGIYLFPCSRVSQAQLPSGSNQWSAPMESLASHLYGDKAPSELASDSSIYHNMHDDDMAALLMDTSSQRQKEEPSRRSPYEGSLLSSPSGLRGGRKLILQTVRPFPSLTPYSNSKGGVSRFKTDQIDGNGNHHRLE